MLTNCPPCPPFQEWPLTTNHWLNSTITPPLTRPVWNWQHIVPPQVIEWQLKQTMSFEHIELPAKLLDYFLRNNKSNISQTVMFQGTSISIIGGQIESLQALWVGIIIIVGKNSLWKILSFRDLPSQYTRERSTVLPLYSVHPSLLNVFFPSFFTPSLLTSTILLFFTLVCVCVCVCCFVLRVEFLLKTESGYLRDAEVTWFTLANP